MKSLQPTFSEIFAVEEQLEQSLYHVLYKGIDKASGQLVLIQHWPTAAMDSPEDKERLNQAVASFQQQTHPHILPIVKTFTQQRGVSLISPYPLQGSLQARLNQQDSKPFSLKKKLAVLQQIGQALSHAHQHHILHGALTPGAVFSTESNQIVVTGFRFQSILEAIPNYHPAQEEHLPDIWYMAPERFDDVLDERTDQYALGCLAYMLLTGQVPFPEHTRAVIIRKHQGEPPQPLTASDPHIPVHIEEAVLKTLAKRPEQRYASIQDFLHALETSGASRSQTRSVPVAVPGNTQKQAAPTVARGNTPRQGAPVAVPGNTQKQAAAVPGNIPVDAAPVADPGNTPWLTAPVAALGNTPKTTAQDLHAQSTSGKRSGDAVSPFLTKAQGTKKRRVAFILGLAVLTLAVILIIMNTNAIALGGQRQANTSAPTMLPTRVVVASHQPTPTAPPASIAAGPTPASPPIVTAPMPAPATKSCRVGYQVTNQGSIAGGAIAGFNVDITITNTGSVAFTNWQLVFSYTQDQTIFTSLNSNFNQNGMQVTVTDDGTNPTIAAGQSITVSLEGGWNGVSNPAPRAFTLNNIACG